MPKFSSEEITSSDNPYELFNREVTREEEIEDIDEDDNLIEEHPHQTLGDIFVENKDTLNSFEPIKQKTLAFVMVAKCPADELRKLGRALTALSSPKDNPEGTFYAAVYPYYETKVRLLGLLDERNKAPHRTLMDSKPYFDKYKSFAESVLKKNEVRIAERLAMYTPVEKRSDVAQCVGSTFARSNFSSLVGAAFSLQRDIEYLLSENPEKFFTSKEFNRDHCLLFSQLFSSIKGHEEEIGIKLAKISSEEIRSDIVKGLRLLNTFVYSSANPFAEIHSSMKKNTLLVGHNPFSSFATKKTVVPTDTAHENDVTLQPEDKSHLNTSFV